MSITDLPTEIVELIASHSDMQDLPQLRLTSNGLYEKTADTCARRLFSELRTDLSRYDLELMVDLAKNTTVAAKVLRLSIKNKDGYIIGGGYRWPRDLEGNLAASESLPGFEKLVSVLQNSLPNCREFDINISCLAEHDCLGSMDVLFLIELLLSKFTMPCTSVMANLTYQDDDDWWADYLPVSAISRPLRPGALEAWASLKHVNLHCVTNPMIVNGWLAGFLSLATSISDLSLTGAPNGSWCHGFWGAVHFEHLEFLKVANLPLGPRFFDGVSKFRTLRCITFANAIAVAQPETWFAFLCNLPLAERKNQGLHLQNVVLGLDDPLGSDDLQLNAMDFSNMPGVRTDAVWQPLLQDLNNQPGLELEWVHPSDSELSCHLGSLASPFGIRTVNFVIYGGYQLADFIEVLLSSMQLVAT